MRAESDWQRLREAVAAALEAPPGGTEEALERAALGDAELMADAREILSHRGERGFLEPPVRGAAGALVSEAAAAAGIGRRFGAYRAVGIIATGGMGTVYRAVRADDAFERVVAVKTIPAALAGTSDRFERERRLLARLSHPGIASLLDGGSTEEGVPYLVIEYVEGEPITEFCRARGYSARRCAEVMRAVCDAVSHAHRNLVVHRDLKPSNILMTPKGTPKLLDFGISKLLDGAGVENDVTLPRALTPRYASPEQVLGEAITTASDVFSLGVVLYELLTGRVPWAGDGSAAEVQARATPPAPVADGDLAAITLRALAPEARERYASAEALGADLERYLKGEPVLARAPTAWYRIGKLVRRNRAASLMGMIAALGIVAAVVALALRAADLARERDRTQRALATAGEINSFLAKTLEAADAGVASGQELTVRAILDEAAARVEHELADRPATAGPLHLTIGRAYLNLGRVRESGAEFERALGAARRSENAEALGEALEALAAWERSNGDRDRAVVLLRESVEIRRRVDGDASPAALEALRMLGDVEGDEGKVREALAGYRALGEGGREGAAMCVETLAFGATARGEVNLAVKLHEEALELARQRVGAESDHTATVLARLGGARAGAGDLEGAEASLREALAMLRRLHGDAHPTITYPMVELADVLEARGKFEEAEGEFVAALRIVLGRLPEEHYIPALLHHRYGQFLARRGRFAEAEAQLGVAYRVCVALFGAEHPSTRAVERVMAETAEIRLKTERGGR